MKRNLIKLTAGIAFSALTFGSFAQEKNIESAVKEYKKYDPITNGVSASIKPLETAKNYIDLAAANAETSESIRMHLNKAKIYFCLIELSKLDSISYPLSIEKSKEYESISKASFKKVLEAPQVKKNIDYTEDAKGFIELRSELINGKGADAYNSKKYETALENFILAHYIKSFIEVNFTDAENNAVQSLNVLVDQLSDSSQIEKALDVSKKTLTIFPKNIDILISIINLYLNLDDMENMSIYLSRALELDPNNKQLYFNLGVSYSQLNKIELSIDAIEKALKIDPNYSEAQSLLALNYFNWAVDVRNSARNMTNQKDPKVQELETQANELFNKAIVPAEIFFGKNPSDKTILEILWKSYGKLGNIEKKESYKKILDDLNKQ